MEPEGGELLEVLTSALAAAIRAAIVALMTLILALLTLLARALQALFILARPASLVGCAVAAGYTTVTLFVTVLARYGEDWPAVILALATVIITPAALLVLAGNHDAWAIMLATAGLEFLAHLGIERAPPPVLALLPVLALTGTMLYFLRADDQLAEEKQEAVNEWQQQERNQCAAVDRDNQPDHLHSNTEL